MSRNIPVIVLLLCGLSTVLTAQNAEPLMVEDQPVPSGVDLVDSISSPATNSTRGVATLVNTSDGVTTLSNGWGDADGVDGVLLITEATIGNLQQTSFEGFWGFADDGSAVYSATCTDTVSGAAGLDTVWLDDQPIAVEEQPVGSLPGQFWSFGSRPGVTADGVPYFIGGITDAAGAATQNRALFFGVDPEPLLMGGDVVTVPGGSIVVSSGGSNISFDYRVSQLGTHYFAEVDIDGAASADDSVMVLDGVGFTLDGSLVREGSVVPGSAGGDGIETWSAFDFLSVTESGDVFMTGATDNGDFVLVGDSIVLREGDTVGGLVIDGAIEGARMNDQGDWAVIWDVEDLVAGNLEALIHDGTIVLREGDSVDTDGDGVTDATLDGFTGISSLCVGDRDTAGNFDIVFTADVVDAAGDTVEVLYRIEIGGSTGAPEFVRGDCNDDGNFDISDAITILDVLFAMGSAPCADACDVNDDGAGDIADAIYALASLFVSGSATPLAPFPGCDEDPSADGTGCASFIGCP